LKKLILDVSKDFSIMLILIIKILKNIDNVYGQSFLMGYYTEMKDPKNAKTKPLMN
jgi:hypothetical protein